MKPLDLRKRTAKRRCRKRGELELLGLILLIVGLVTVCAFLLPPRIWLILLGFGLVYLGYRIYQW